MSLLEKEIVWMAALFEGEGSISGNHKVDLGSTDRDIIERFSKITSAPIYKIKKQQPHHKDAWRVCFSKRNDVLRNLLLMLPHLGERRSQRAREALRGIIKWKKGRMAGQKQLNLALTVKDRTP